MDKWRSKAESNSPSGKLISLQQNTPILITIFLSFNTAEPA